MTVAVDTSWCNSFCLELWAKPVPVKHVLQICYHRGGFRWGDLLWLWLHCAHGCHLLAEDVCNVSPPTSACNLSLSYATISINVALLSHSPPLYIGLHVRTLLVAHFKLLLSLLLLLMLLTIVLTHFTICTLLFRLTYSLYIIWV